MNLLNSKEMNGTQYIEGQIDDPEDVRSKALKRLDGLYRDVFTNIERSPRILIPINKDFHWHLLEINLKEKFIYDYNSLSYKHDKEMERWIYWWYYYTNWKGLSLRVDKTWRMDVVQSNPQ